MAAYRCRLGINMMSSSKEPYSIRQPRPTHDGAWLSVRLSLRWAISFSFSSASLKTLTICGLFGGFTRFVGTHDSSEGTG